MTAFAEAFQMGPGGAPRRTERAVIVGAAAQAGMAGMASERFDSVATQGSGRHGERPLDPDLALVQRAGRGDRQAAELLVARHLRRIHAFCRRMLRDGGDAEDVAQEVFLRAWKAAPRWREGEAKFETWLYRVAANLCVDQLRRRRRYSGDEPPEQADLAPAAADQMMARQRADRVAAAVAELPERQRIAIILCHYQEMTNIEAAAALSLSVDALESLLARARRGLRTRLAEIGRDLLGEEAHADV